MLDDTTSPPAFTLLPHVVEIRPIRAHRNFQVRKDPSRSAYAPRCAPVPHSCCQVTRIAEVNKLPRKEQETILRVQDVMIARAKAS